MKGRKIAPCAALALLAAASASAANLNLYDWMATAPVVVASRVVSDDRRYVDVEVFRTFRGGIAVGQRLSVDQKDANGERDPGKPALRLEGGKEYLLLLRLSPRKSQPLTYELVRGTEGAREIPAEGGALWIEAAERFTEIQARKDDEALWRSLATMLEETNPILLETSLDLFQKFRRGDAGVLPVLRPILDHPRDDLRLKAAVVIGQVLERIASSGGDVEDDLLSEVIGHARRDGSIPVRVAATHALGSVRQSRVDEVLREVARDDPEQLVRYEAERQLFERGAKGPPKAGEPRPLD